MLGVATWGKFTVHMMIFMKKFKKKAVLKRARATKCSQVITTLNFIQKKIIFNRTVTHSTLEHEFILMELMAKVISFHNFSS
jgi:hypothetical protein